MIVSYKCIKGDDGRCLRHGRDHLALWDKVLQDNEEGAKFRAILDRQTAAIKGNTEPIPKPPDGETRCHPGTSCIHFGGVLTREQKRTLHLTTCAGWGECARGRGVIRGSKTYVVGWFLVPSGCRGCELHEGPTPPITIIVGPITVVKKAQ